MKKFSIPQTNLPGIIILGACASIGYAQLSSASAALSEREIRPTETVISNNRIEKPNQYTSIEGVCKLDAMTAQCWNPDGSANPSLTNTINESIKHTDSNDYRNYPVTFGRKYRFLILKELRYNRSSGGHLQGDLFTWNKRNSGNVDGWTQSSNTLGSASASGFDNSYTTYSVIEGNFAKDVKTFPFRYSYRANRTTNKTIPAKPGTFEIEGNTFTLKQVENAKKPKGTPNNGQFGYGASLQPLTEVFMQVDTVNNPLAAFTVFATTEDDKIISFADSKGMPANAEVAQKWMNTFNSTPFDKRPKVVSYGYAGTGYFDAANMTNGNYIPVAFNVAKDKVKKLTFMSTSREVFVFPDVALEPK